MVDDNPPSEKPGAPPGSLRELLQVAFPLVISAGSISLMNVIDRAFLARVSVDALAASTPTAILHWTIMSFAFGIAGYANAFISQYEGAGRKDRVAASVWQGLFFAIVGGILLLPSIRFAPQIFSWMGHSPEVQELEVQYFTTLCPASIPILISTVLTAFFTARKRTALVMCVNIGGTLLNAIFAWLLIFGNWGFPELGIRGAGLSTLIATFSECVAFGLVITFESRRYKYPFMKTLGLDRQLLWRMLRYGVPNGVQASLDIGAFMAFIAIVGRLGTEAQAATNIAFSLNSLAFIPITGMGTSVLTLVGRRVGEGRPELAAKTVWKAFAISGGYMLAFSALYLTIPDVVLTPFVSRNDAHAYEELRPIVISLLRFVALYTFFDAMAIIFGAAVRGAGDTVFSLIFTVITGWMLMVVPTLWMLKHGGGLYACWGACTAFVIVCGMGFLLRFMQGRWKKMRIIEPAVQEQVIAAEPLIESAQHPA
ncbi:MATE family efflux transporter [Planctomicrobium sp. SH664]|uniref:MATE family efflux transporter n=1 Tax=Planctomicrobium sp. SH664 TaxID=3448125 RepID=UPI003F5C650B